MQQALFKRDKNISQNSDTKFCCRGHDGLRKDHKQSANRRFRHTGKITTQQDRLQG